MTVKRIGETYFAQTMFHVKHVLAGNLVQEHLPLASISRALGGVLVFIERLNLSKRMKPGITVGGSH